MQILYVGQSEIDETHIQKQLDGHNVFFIQDISTVQEELASSIEILSVFVDTVVDEFVLMKFPKLLCLATRSAGFDHIAVEEAQKRGIVISRVPHYGSQTVAEYTFALMFALSRNAFQSSVAMKAQGYVADLLPYEGFDLSGKILGVVGTGKIGEKVCGIAQSFGMHVIAYDAFQNENVKTQGIPYVDLPTLMKTSDMVTLHVPGGPKTHHLITSELLSLMKPTAHLINTARGEVVDTKALVEALKAKTLAGAGLDVLECEHEFARESTLTETEKSDVPLMELLSFNRALIAMTNVVVTPHIAFNTREAKAEITSITLENIRAFATGTPINIVVL